MRRPGIPSYAWYIAHAKKLLARDEKTAYLSFRQWRPWEGATAEIDEFGSGKWYRINSMIWVSNPHPCGLTFRWSVSLSRCSSPRERADFMRLLSILTTRQRRLVATLLSQEITEVLRSITYDSTCLEELATRYKLLGK